MLKILLITLAILFLWNLVTFLMMVLDKHRAKKGKWRIRERTLLICSFLMGGFGIYFGMIGAHHKTKHKKFQILVPVSLVMNIIIFIWTLYHFIK